MSGNIDTPPFTDSWTSLIAIEAMQVWKALNCVHRGFPPGLGGAGGRGYTYAIQAAGDGLIKIGQSKYDRIADFDRLSKIQAMSPVRLRVVAIMSGAFLEGYWHDKFKRQRVHCEWFKPEVADWFRANGAPGCLRCTVFGDSVMQRRRAPNTTEQHPAP